MDPEPASRARDEGAAGAPDGRASSRSRGLLGKALLLVALALGGAVLARFPAVREAFSPAGEVSRLLRDHGWTAAPVFVVIAAILIAVGVPRLIFCPLAGAAFGFAGGMATSTVATIVAYTVMFGFLRGRWADRAARVVLPESLAFLRQDPGMAGVIIARLLPVPGLLATVALSLSRVGWRDYLWGSFVGLLPEAAPLVLLGAGILAENTRQLTWLGSGVIILFIAGHFLVRRWTRRSAGRPRS